MDVSYCYGGKLDTPSQTDRVYRVSEKPCAIPGVPGVVDLTDRIEHVYHQNGLNSCTACAVCAAYSLHVATTNDTSIPPSRLFLYYNARRDHSKDGGAYVRDAIKAFKRHGVCSEAEWPYEGERVNRRPPQMLYCVAKGGVEGEGEEVLPTANAVPAMKACLDEGSPIVFSFNTYKVLESNLMGEHNGYIFQLPASLENVEPRPHTVMAVGYDNNNGLIKILNSWGVQFGDSGCFYMPYNLITDKTLYGGHDPVFFRINFTSENHRSSCPCSVV